MPPQLPAGVPLVVSAPSPPVGDAPPRLPLGPARRIIAGLLSLCLALYLADALLSVVVASFTLLFGVQVLTTVCALVSMSALLVGLVVYGLMGVTPMIPKRLFLPIALFNPVGLLAIIPVVIYAYDWLEQVGWIISLFQLALGVLILRRVQGGFRLRWPLVPESRLQPRAFGWVNLSGFLAVNILVLLPLTIVYLAVCAGLAVHHSTGGFLALHPGGFTVQVRKYVRDDGKSVLLVPMAHIGEADFYRKLSHSFPTNSVVLMEGVTDNKNLLTNNISYKRMATKLGLTEQQEEFNPVEVELVMADIDVEQFTTNTIGLVNLVMLIHAKGLTAQTLPPLLGFSAPPHFEEQLLDDLVRKRNQHVLQEIRDRLPNQKPIVVPWGVAHMPGISDGIKALGFRLADTRDYTVIRFHFARSAARPKSGPTRRMAD